MNEKYQQIIKTITAIVTNSNLDNITRTIAYQQYYEKNKEIKWAFLASMVSRNAGWNMTDLEGIYFPKMLAAEKRKQIFHTYERANWLIFQDAFPQLLVYEYSKKLAQPLFELLPLFQVSNFMINEWKYFWEKQDKERLLIALIVNEQWTIQKPVVEHPFYSREIFSSLFYKVQDLFHISYVIFPTVTGELFGDAVTKFKEVEQRIILGKKLAYTLFHPRYHPSFYTFARNTPPTGSRLDYEQYLLEMKKSGTPSLRDAYSPIFHSRDRSKDWYHASINTDKYFVIENYSQKDITKTFLWKRKYLYFFITIQERMMKKLGKKQKISKNN